MKKLHLILLTTCLIFMAFQCEDDTASTKESQQQDLSVSKKAIEDLAATSICNETFTCKFIALGSKPCGGPWGYLVYSTSVNIEKLENMVLNYNKKESDFNKKWGVASDCMYLMPPTKVNCENNTCVAVY
ncbi:hypothetical protein QLS71_006075 [Mariniflexile litorale]|uniref:Lipoprotein n=1 Tax=Mariniflexile litorale TaxID=3045158 RepID=A0AAU7EIV8_9FLAO|nr:hypothetical protein [Mariniflexile sp. KMM 9835]MDQ8211145.1 hypothetical protein [Mariniflexile sp. KMM 9835]